MPEFSDDFEKLIKTMDNDNDNESKEMHILGDLDSNTLRTDKDVNIPTKTMTTSLH